MASNKTATIIFKGDDQISPAIKGATASVAGLKGALNSVSATAASTGADIKKAVTFDSLQLNAISQSFGAIAGKLTELKGAAVGAFTEIAKAERKLSTVSNESKQLVKNFGDLAAANKFQTTTAELATASYEVLSAGFTDTADVTQILEASTKGAIGGFSDVTTVSKATISALNAYGAGADQAASFVDKFVSVQQSGLITVDQYASQIARIAPTAAAAGLSLDELNGAIATATASGVPVESTFAGLRGAIAAILKPSGEAVELAKELGLNFNAAGLKTLGLSGILKQLKTTGNDSADTLLKLFGSTEALAAIAPSINAIEKLEANIKASANSAGLASTNFEKAIDPAKALANQTTEALAKLGANIVKVFNPVLSTTKAVVQAFIELPEPLQQVIAFVVGGGAAIATTGAAISGFLAVLSPTLAGLTALTTALGSVNLVAGLAKINMALFSPVVLTAGASSATASIGITGLGTALAGLATTAAAALIPLGLLVAAVKGAEFAKFANDIKGFNEELDILQAGDQTSQRQATVLFGKIRNLNEERKKGVAINEEQRQGFIRLADQEIATQKAKLDAAKALKPANEEQKNAQAAQIFGIQATLKAYENQRKALAENVAVATKANQSAARSEKDVEDAIKSRIELEKRGLEDRARLSGRAFEKQAKGESGDFEKQARTEKQAFEKQLNLDKKVFEDAQNADKKKFEDSLFTDAKLFTDAQKADQKTFDIGQKALDNAYEKEKQGAQQAFDLAQQAQKEAFDKQQQAAALAFDKTQNDDKKTADDQFVKRRLEIERKLQLDAAKTPEDKAKLEAEFKATDEKIAKEKLAFEQLKADELAFAEKQKADKIAFDEAQKAAQKAEEEAQKLAKQTFDDAQKAKDDQREIDKQALKEAFETQLNLKKEAFDAAQNLKKEAFDVAQAAKKQALEDAQNLKKQEFEDAERAKKTAFDDEQNAKKTAFEDAERKKKEAFEDNLKVLEAKFKAEERAKDIATAQQVAAIKLSSNTTTGATNAAVGIGATPRASGGSFRAGQQLLVGERGQELVTFGASGYVSSATDTKQILSSNNKAPSSVSTARMEALLGQLVGKLDRPNVSVQTSETPSDVLVKIQREAARADAMRSGI